MIRLDWGFWILGRENALPKPKITLVSYQVLLISGVGVPQVSMQQAQHFAGLFGIEDDAVLRELDGATPVEALGVAQQVQAVDGHLRIFRQADDVVAQATMAGQFAGERGQREVRLLGNGRRPNVLNSEHFGVSSKKNG
jgi:hypothetical protein